MSYASPLLLCFPGSDQFLLQGPLTARAVVDKKHVHVTGLIAQGTINRVEYPIIDLTCHLGMMASHIAPKIFQGLSQSARWVTVAFHDAVSSGILSVGRSAYEKSLPPPRCRPLGQGAAGLCRAPDLRQPAGHGAA